MAVVKINKDYGLPPLQKINFGCMTVSISEQTPRIVENNRICHKFYFSSSKICLSDKATGVIQGSFAFFTRMIYV